MPTEGLDHEALKGAVEGYVGRSREITDADFLNLAEEELEKLQAAKGFSFPTNEGMRKITKIPETEEIGDDPVLSKITASIRTTIEGVESPKEGGLYAGVNAFHHGHLAYISKSEAITAVDMNKIIPYGFAFIVGMAGGAKNSEDFKKQVALMATNPQLLRDAFEGTDLESTIFIEGDTPPIRDARQKLLTALLETMAEFNPLIHGQRKIPPVFCEDADAYDYFRTIAIQDKVAGAHTKLQGQGFMDVLAKSLQTFPMNNPALNTLYVSSCFDPRFLGAKERGRFFRKLGEEGHSNTQIIESFLNSGWITYNINEKPD